MTLVVLTSMGAVWLPVAPAGADHVTLSSLSGSGTSGDPYVITDVHELQAMELDLDAHYVFGNDIDASVTSGWNGGSGFDPIGNSTTAFTGSLDGAGYHIANLTIDRPGESEVGLFGRVGLGGNLTEVWLLDVNVTGNARTGSLAGRSYGTITKAFASGTILGGGSSGGLVGNNAGEITRSYTNVTVDTHTSQTNDVGGLTGVNSNNGLVANSSTAGDVSISGNGWSVGGIVGFNSAGTVSDSFATGSVTGSDSGGLVGRNDDTVSDSYWDTETTGQSSGIDNNNGQATAVTGLTTAQMTGGAAEGNLSQLDFASTWVGTDSYPVLRWRVASLSVALDATTIQNGSSTNATVTLTLVEAASVTATETAAYSSNDTSVATVTSAGLVNATSVGSASITASLAGRSNSATLTVEADTTPPTISGFTLTNPSGATLNVSFDSDESLASISVSITGDATATLTSFTQDGSTYTGSVDVGTTGSFTATLDTATDAAGNDGGSGQSDSVTVTGSGPGGMLGSGTSSDPYLVTTVDQLQAMAGEPSATYELRNSIDASATGGWNSGNGFAPVGNTTTTFSGTFDGNRYPIWNLTIDRTGEDYVGLFGYVSGTVENVTIADAAVSGRTYVGVVAGWTTGTITKVSATGSVTGADSVGGIAGRNKGTVSRSRTDVNVSGSGTLIGGVVGAYGVNSGTVETSYALGNVTGGDYTGGFSGRAWNAGLGQDSFAAGAVSGARPGGLIGRDEASSGGDLYWDINTTGQTTGVYDSDGLSVTGLTTAEMTGTSAATNMAGLDFNSVWETTDSYPALQWEPRFSVTVQSTNAPVDEGTNLTVTFSVTNDGASGSQALTLTDFDGTVREVVFVRLGDGETNSSITLTWSTAVGENGTGSVTVSSVTDAAGSSVTIQDAIAPAAPTALDLSTANDSGQLSTDNVTNVTTPTISGTAEANATVNVTSDLDGVIGNPTADSNGNWSFTPGSALSEGTHAITANATDAAGNTGTDSQTLTLVIDTTAPATPSIPDLDTVNDTGASSTDNITNETAPTFSGTAEANATIALSSDVDGSLGTTTADTNGAWSFTPGSALSTGTHNLTANVTDVAGNAGPTSAALTLTVDTTAPNAPSTPDLSAASDTGNSTTDNLTNDTTPTFSGTAEAGTTVDVQSNRSGSLGSSVVDNDGNWTVTATSDLPNGTHSISATATDTAGNIGPASATLNLTIDDTAPTVNASGNGTYDEDTAVTFDASNSTDDRGILSYDWTFGDGSTATGVAPTHTFADPGNYSVAVTVRDEAGNAANETLQVVIEDVASPQAQEEEEPAQAQLSELRLAGVALPLELVSGEAAAVSVNLSNVGGTEGSFAVTLTVLDGTSNEVAVSRSTTATLAAGEFTVLTFENVTGGLGVGAYTVTVESTNTSISGMLTIEQPGKVELSDLELAGQGAAASVVAGEAASLSVALANVGDRAVTVAPTVTVTANGTAVSELDADAVKIDGGESVELTVADIASGLDAGEYTVTVATANASLTGTLEVLEPLFVEVTTLDIAGSGPAATLEVGTQGSVAAEVTNTGGVAGLTTVTITIQDATGSTVPETTESNLVLEPDESRTVTLASVLGGLGVGSYTVRAETPDDTTIGTLVIEERLNTTESESGTGNTTDTPTDEAPAENESTDGPQLAVMDAETEASLNLTNDSRTVMVVGENYAPGEQIRASLRTNSTAGLAAHISILNATLLAGGNFTVQAFHASTPKTGVPTYEGEGDIALQYIGFEIRVEGEPITETPFANETIRLNVSIEHLPANVTAADVRLYYHVNPWFENEVRFLNATDEYLVFEAEVDGLPDLVVVVPESNGTVAENESSGLLPFRLPDLPGDPGAAEAVAGGATLSLGWALKPFLRDMIATFLIYFERSYRVGDLIEWGNPTVGVLALAGLRNVPQGLEENLGVVKEIGYRSTVVQAVNGAEVSVPNAILAGGVLANSSAGGPLRLDIDVPVSLGADLPLAKETMLTAANEEAAVLSDPGPAVIFRAFEPDRIRLQVRVWIDRAAIDQRYRITDAVSRAVTEALGAAGLGLDYPSRDLEGLEVSIDEAE